MAVLHYISPALEKKLTDEKKKYEWTKKKPDTFRFHSFRWANICLGCTNTKWYPGKSHSNRKLHDYFNDHNFFLLDFLLLLLLVCVCVYRPRNDKQKSVVVCVASSDRYTIFNDIVIGFRQRLMSRERADNKQKWGKFGEIFQKIFFLSFRSLVQFVIVVIIIIINFFSLRIDHTAYNHTYEWILFFLIEIGLQVIRTVARATIVLCESILKCFFLFD